MIYPNYYDYQQTIQNGGFVSVQNESMARAYPVRHGMSVTFRDENAPFIYVKTLGFGQLDSPVFEKYRLIKEPSQDSQGGHIQTFNSEVEHSTTYVTKAEFGALQSVTEALAQKVDDLRKELGDELQ